MSVDLNKVLTEVVSDEVHVVIVSRVGDLETPDVETRDLSSKGVQQIVETPSGTIVGTPGPS
jgi:hypothetical protein